MLARYLRALPFALAGIHAIVTIFVWVVAMRNFERAAMLPVIVYSIDLPASLLISFIDSLLFLVTMKLFDNYMLAYALSGALYLVLGTAWWFGIGKAIGYVVKEIQLRFQS